MTDFVISNDLVVFGMSTFAGGQTFDGQMILDVDNTEALLVRKDGDGGDVFVVDTVNSLVQLPGSVALEIGTTPAAAGSIRLSNAASIVIRNANDNNDITILVSPQSDEFDLFNSTVPRITLKNAVTTFEQRVTVQQVGTSTASLTVGGTMLVDTTNAIIRVGAAAGATIRGSNAAAFAAINQAASGTVPMLIPRRDSLTTGIGAAAADRLSFINLGVETVKIIDGGRFAITQPEQVSIGSGSFVDNVQVNITGTFLDDYGGGPTTTHKFLVNGSVEGDATRTVALNGAQFSAQVITQTATENIANISQVQIDEPLIIDNLTGDITNAQTLLISGAPTEGESNWALRILGGDVQLPSAGALQWSTDLKLFRDGPWELALRDGTNDNFFYVYGTFTDSSNYERLALYAGSSVLYVLEPQSAGTGNNTINMAVRALGGGALTLGSLDNSDGWSARGFNFSFWKGTPEARTFLDISSVLLSALAGASVTTANLIPAGSIVLGITVRVETTITGPATFSIGDGVDVDRWGTGILVAAGTRTDITDYTSTNFTYNLAGNADVTITSDGVDFTGGDIRVVCHYMKVFAPTTS